MLCMILRIDAQIDRASGHAYVSLRHVLRCSYMQYIRPGGFLDSWRKGVAKTGHRKHSSKPASGLTELDIVSFQNEAIGRHSRPNAADRRCASLRWKYEVQW